MLTTQISFLPSLKARKVGCRMCLVIAQVCDRTEVDSGVIPQQRVASLDVLMIKGNNQGDMIYSRVTVAGIIYTGMPMYTGLQISKHSSQRRFRGLQATSTCYQRYL